jgi:hypothetical protein
MGTQVLVAGAQATDAQTKESFDDMLTEFWTGDLITQKIPEKTMIPRIMHSDITELRWWAKQGARVGNVEPLFLAAMFCKVDVIRCLVCYLGADPNQANAEGFTPLCVALLGSNIAVV